MVLSTTRVRWRCEAHSASLALSGPKVIVYPHVKVGRGTNALFRAVAQVKRLTRQPSLARHIELKPLRHAKTKPKSGGHIARVSFRTPSDRVLGIVRSGPKIDSLDPKASPAL